MISEYIRYYNEKRLNSATGYIAPADKLEEARKRRAQARQSAA